jgi:hypothetical protein
VGSGRAGRSRGSSEQTQAGPSQRVGGHSRGGPGSRPGMHTNRPGGGSCCAPGCTAPRSTRCPSG